ncbi:MAG TPA: hypothetical protein VJ831_15015 [Jatrophihabitantaceae bacterium]|nr:hypothetical protein [Jatrophihabitantaceae bacterium]
MSTISTPAARVAASSERSTGSRRWPLFGLAAGVLGAVGTLFTMTTADGTPVTAESVNKLSGTAYHIGGAAGYLAVACLLILAAAWRAKVTRFLPGNVAARLVADGITASAGALMLGYGWKLAMSLYLPNGLNDDNFDKQGRFVYYMLNDFGPFIGWLGVVIAAGAVAYLSLREKLIATWLGVVSLLPVIGVLGMSLGMSVAGYPGMVGPAWLILASAGLTFGTHRITALQD